MHVDSRDLGVGVRKIELGKYSMCSKNYEKVAGIRISKLGMCRYEKTQENDTAVKVITNAEAARPDRLSAELLKLGAQPTNRPRLARANLPTVVEDAVITVLHKKDDKTGPGSYCDISHIMSHAGNEFLKVPGELYITVRSRDCYQRGNAVFDRIAQPRI